MKGNFYKIALVLISALFLSVTASAIPAKRGVKRIITLPQGQNIEVTLAGDEHFHYYISADGRYFISNDDSNFELLSDTQVKDFQAQATARKAKRDAAMQRRVGEVKNKAIFRGERKGLIILANFTDKKFSMDDPKALYDRIANEINYNEGKFKGSVRDYFHDNSYGKFQLTFDIVGPVELSHNIAYYGRNQSNIAGNDIRPEEMVREAVLAVDDEVDFSIYDWDNDGEVDQIFVVYAGYNEAQGGAANTIWPHMSLLKAYNKEVTLDNVTINTYACSSELANSSGTQVDGIGTICHEFSHCMGFPDMYDTSYRNFGMGDWSLMNSGCYNGDGYRPSAYTSYERMTCGWLEPLELKEAVKVKGMKGLTEGGESYIIYADNQARTEYYLLENRQPVSWDDALPGKGLMITHIDYDPTIWKNNSVNTTGYYNGHQRLTIYHADNNEGGYYKYSDAGDLYPYQNNNSWTSSSLPAAVQYKGTDTAKKLEDREVTDITLNDDGTIDFTFHLASEEDPVYRSIYLDQNTTEPIEWEDGAVYNVHSNRLFASGEWETLWLPFSMSNDDFISVFGDNVEIALFSNVSADGDIAYFETTTDGVEASTPMLIKVNTTDELNDMGTLVQKTFGQLDKEITTTVDNYSFNGIRFKNDEVVDEYTISADYFNANHDAATSVKAYQATMSVTTDSLRKGIKISLDGNILNDEADTSFIEDNPDEEEDPEEPNGISLTQQGTDTNNLSIYDILGRKVASMIEGKTFIIEGKKILLQKR